MYYGGYHDKHRVIMWLWNILKNEFNSQQKASFLKVVIMCRLYSYLILENLISCIIACVHVKWRSSSCYTYKNTKNLEKNDRKCRAKVVKKVLGQRRCSRTTMSNIHKPNPHTYPYVTLSWLTRKIYYSNSVWQLYREQDNDNDNVQLW